jgi:hypothetical protein
MSFYKGERVKPTAEGVRRGVTRAGNEGTVAATPRKPDCVSVLWDGRKGSGSVGRREMAKFAAQTSVSVEKSRNEIEAILRRYGADGFRYGWRDVNARRVEQIEFTAKDRHIRFTLTMPAKDADEFKWTAHKDRWQRKRRSESATLEAWQQSCRQRWRALCLCIKAKLEAVESGISEFETEFLAFIMDPETGRTIGDTILPQIKLRYESGGGHIGLPGLPSPEDFANETIDTTTV